MPTLNKRERIEAVMRYIHAHRWQQNTADSISKALNIPVATLRKTLTTDYPECFDRDPDDRRNIILVPFIWPDNRRFDLEPAPDKTSKLKAEHMTNATLKGVLQPEVLDYFTLWTEQGIALKKTPDEYWRVWNSLNLALAMMQLIKSKDPQDKARRLFDDPNKLPEAIKNSITVIERGLNQA